MNQEEEKGDAPLIINKPSGSVDLNGIDRQNSMSKQSHLYDSSRGRSPEHLSGEEFKDQHQPNEFHETFAIGQNEYVQNLGSDAELEMIQIEKQKKLLQLEILELEKLEMQQRKSRALSRQGSPDSRKSHSRVRASRFFHNESQQDPSTIHEESDIILLNKRKKSKKQTIRYNEDDSDSSFEYFRRDQLSSRRDSHGQNPFNNTGQNLLQQEMVQTPDQNTIQVGVTSPVSMTGPDSHFIRDSRTPNWDGNQIDPRKMREQMLQLDEIKQEEIMIRKSVESQMTKQIFEETLDRNDLTYQKTPQGHTTMSNLFDMVIPNKRKNKDAISVSKVDKSNDELNIPHDIDRNSQKTTRSRKGSKNRQKSKKSKTKSRIEEEHVMSEAQQEALLSQMDENGRVPPPTQPQFYLHGKIQANRPNQGGAIMGGDDDDDDAPKNFFEPISYRKLMRVVCSLHPIDQETKTRFNIKDRITIKDYEAKLSDACFCYALGQKVKETSRYLRQRMRGKKQTKFIRPESMADLPDSNSSENSDREENNGITECSLALGDGATLYLQMMKTFSIMFFILSLLNIPIYVLYEQNTDGNDFRSLGKIFKLFTIGNLGQLTKKCGFSDFHWHFHDTEPPLEQKVHIDCEAGYIGEIQQFGFLYKNDKLYGGDSEGNATCEHIMDPVAPYKKPPLVPITCSQDELEDDEYELCLVDQEFQKGTISEEEMLQYQRVIENSYLPENERLPDEIILQPEQSPYLHDTWNFEEFEIQLPENPDTEQDIVDINIDPKCLYNPRIDGKKASNLWYDKDSYELFQNYFVKHCYYKQKCVLDPDEIGYKKGDFDEDGYIVPDHRLGLFGLISDDCKLRMSHPIYQNITSQIYIGIFGCKYDDVKIPLSQVRLHKEIIGIIIVAVDFTSILIMIYFFSKINVLNNEFLSSIDDLRVQMKDFGVKINNVKLDKYTLDSRIVKIKIWLYFKEILEFNKDKYNDMQCIDVCLSLYTQPSIQCVFRMQEIQLEINAINNKLYTGQYKEDEIPDKQEELKMLLEKQKRFEVRYKQLTQRPKVDKENQNLTVTRIPKSQKIKEIQYIFVVFKNCETREVVLQKFRKDNVTLSCFKKCFPSDDPMESNPDQKLLFGRKIDVVPNLDPDEIIWENLAYTGDEQKARKLAINIFSVFFLLFNTLFTMYLSGFSVFMNKAIPDAIGCPDVEITKKEAFQDAIKGWDNDESEGPVGLMGCYCKENTSIFLPWTIVRHNFVEFSDLNVYKSGDDKKNYCLQWWGLQYLKELCLFFVSTSAVFINEIVADFFQKLGQFQKKHTKVEEQTTCFRQIFTQEYINMGLIVLIQSFDQLGITKMLLGQLSSNSPVYTGFEPNWYMTFGNKVCVMIFMSSFLVNSKDVARFVYTVLLRLKDRKFRMNIKLDPEDEDCDLPNTRIRIQSDLEKLYTGNMFKGEKAYSRMMSTMFVIQMYSSGMPILYFNGFIFYTVTYCVNKFLLINYYQKSRTLTRTIPLFTMEYLKYGILLHLMAACLMLTNKLSFVTKNRDNGVKPLYNTKLGIEVAQEYGVSEKNSFIETFKDRFQFFHQQLYFTLLVSLIFTFFIGRSTYALIWFILTQSFKMIQSCVQRSYNRVKMETQMLIDKRAREKKEIEDKLKENLARQVFANVKRQAAEKAKEEKKKYEDKIDNLQDELESESNEEQKQQIQNQILMNEIENQQREESEENSAGRLKNLDEDGIPLSEDEQFKRFKDGLVARKQSQTIEETKKMELEIRRELQKKRLQRPDYSDNIIGEFSTENLSNFYERSIRELHDFWEIFQYNKEISQEFLDPESTSPYRTLFLETLYTFRISVDECIAYQSFLTQRIKDIEVIIDKYFDLLIPTLILKMKESFDKDRNRRKKEGKEGTLKDQVMQRKYEEWFVKHSNEVQFHDEKYYSYKRKMKILVELQDELIAADKNRKDNRQGIQDICRMTGSLSQSYFIFDAQQFKVGRKIYYGIEIEEEVVDELGDLLNEGSEPDKKQPKSVRSKQVSSSESSSLGYEDQVSKPTPPKSNRKANKSDGGGKKSSRKETVNLKIPKKIGLNKINPK